MGDQRPVYGKCPRGFIFIGTRLNIPRLRIVSRIVLDAHRRFFFAASGIIINACFFIPFLNPNSSCDEFFLDSMKHVCSCPHKESISAKRHFNRRSSWPVLHTLLEKPQFPSASATPVPLPLENSYVHGIVGTAIFIAQVLVNFAKKKKNTARGK